jgi:putative nucleotidyltransferase with HDIG domain
LAGSSAPYHTEHGLYTAFVAKEIAASLSLGKADTGFLVLAALLHDAGKAALPTRIADADPATLTGDDRAFYESHVAETVKLLSQTGLPAKVIDIVRQHHELRDGSGFPVRLSGTAILPEAQILAVADVYHNGVSRFQGERGTQPETEREERAEKILQWFRPREHLYSPHIVQGLFAVADHLHDAAFQEFARTLPLSDWEPFFPDVAAHRKAAAVG